MTTPSRPPVIVAGGAANAVFIARSLGALGVRVYGGTFFTFSDYMRGSIRLAALSEYPVIYVFTHDSIGLGEDGPTHQPIEQLAAVRAIPNLVVIRPADANESVAAWRVAMERAHQEQCYPRELTFPSSAPGQQLCPGDYGWDAAIATPHANERRRRHRH